VYKMAENSNLSVERKDWLLLTASVENRSAKRSSKTMILGDVLIASKMTSYRIRKSVSTDYHDEHGWK
jgi:hypothetical protein